MSTMQTTFQFEIDQKVETPFGDVGIINMAAVDENKHHTYYVKRSVETQWFKESQLKAVE